MATKKTTKTQSAKSAAKVAPVKKPAAAKAVKVPEPVAEEVGACPVKAAKKSAAPKATRVTFRVRAEIGSKVFLAGCFNGWSPTAKPMTDKDGTGEFACTVNLPKGKYEYKFVINGSWCADPECAEWVQNDMGTLNSVKIVD